MPKGDIVDKTVGNKIKVRLNGFLESDYIFLFKLQSFELPRINLVFEGKVRIHPIYEIKKMRTSLPTGKRI